MRDATKKNRTWTDDMIISIHASHAGCDLILIKIWQHIWYFNPRIPCGMRRRQPIQRPQGIDFNPRIPCGMRRLLLASFRQSRYFNPRIPCGMRQTNAAMSRLTYEISIHASHAGCDRAYNKALTRNINFNPRIPCGMRRYWFFRCNSNLRFQSTHPMRDATSGDCLGESQKTISIHASHAGCDVKVTSFYFFIFISIHASHAGCDCQKN